MSNLAVSVAVIRNEKISLTKREDFEIWCLPGGIVDDNESLAEAAIREIREETGAQVELNRLAWIYSRVGGMRDEHAVLFRGTQIGGELRDRSSLSRRQFYLQLVKSVEINDRIEVSGQ